MQYWGYNATGNAVLGALGNYRVAFAPDGDNAGNDLSAAAINNGVRTNWYHSTWGAGRTNNSLYAISKGGNINGHIAANNAALLLNTNYDKFIIDLGRVSTVTGIGYMARSSGTNSITDAEIWVMSPSVTGDVTASDAHMLNMIAHPDWSLYAATGASAWNHERAEEKTLAFPAVQTRYIALRVRRLSGTGAQQLTASNIRLFGAGYLAAGLWGANDTGNRATLHTGTESGMINMGQRQGNDTRRIYSTAGNEGSGYLVDFSGITTSAQTGNVTNPVGGNYNLKQRGPENGNQNLATTPIAFSNRSHRSGNQAFGGRNGIRDSLASLQVWINVGGEMQWAIQNGFVESLTFDFYFAVGAYAWVGSTIQERNAGTETYLDLSYRQDTLPLATIDNYAYPTDRRLTAARQGDIYASSRAALNAPANGTRSTWGLSDCSVQNGAQWGRFQHYPVTINHTSPHLRGIANNGGFWLKLTAHGMAWTSASGWSTAGAESEAAAVFEGVRMNAAFSSVTFESNDASMGSVDNTARNFFPAQPPGNTTFTATATPAINHYFVDWTGEGIPDYSNNFSVTTTTYENFPGGHHTVTANFAPIPIDGGDSFVYNQGPQGPAINAPSGHVAFNARYRGRNGNLYDSNLMPTNVGEYNYTADLIRAGVVVGQVNFDFTINRARGAAGVIILDGWTWGEASNIPTVIGQTDEYGDPIFEYRHHGTGNWVSNQPTDPGTHNVRATFTATDNYYAENTPVHTFVISKIQVAVPVPDDSLIFNWDYQIPGEWLFDNDLDFTISGEDFAFAAGDYELTLTLKDPAHFEWADGNQNAERVIIWTIAPKAFEGTVELGENNFIFNGLSQIPNIFVFDGSFELFEGENFNISVSSNAEDAGEKVITITFIGNFAGTETAEYTIAKAQVAIPGAPVLEFNRSVQDITELLGGEGLFTLSGEFYAAGAGEYTAWLTLINPNNFVWADGIEEISIEIIWTIFTKVLDDTALALENADFTYNQNEQIPDIIVTDGDALLLRDVDYTVGDFDAINAGTKTIVITFIGNYTGTASAEFTILRYSVALPAAVANIIYNGQAQSPAEWVNESFYFTASGEISEISAGNYTAILTINDTVNYKWADGEDGASRDVEWTIRRRMLSWNNDGEVEIREFNGTTNAAIAIAPTFGGLITGDKVFVASGTVEFATANAENNIAILVAGFGIIGADIGNYEITGQPIFAAGTIKPKVITVTPVEGQGKVFGEDEPAVFLFTHDALIGTDTIGGFLARAAGENAGSYLFVLGTLSAVSNYTLVVDESVKFEIAKAAGEGSVYMADWEFGKAPSAPLPISATNDINNVSFRFTGITNAGVEYDSADKPAQAGSYTVIATFAQTVNHLEVTASAYFVIHKAELAANINIADWTFRTTTSDPQIIGLPTDYDGEIVFEFKARGAADSTFTTDKPAEAGEYVIRATFAETDNYKFYQITTNFTVNRAAGSGSVIIDGWIYGEAASSPVASGAADDYDGEVTFEYKVKGAADNTFSLFKPVNAGEYTVRAIFPVTNNYERFEARFDFVIEKAAVSGNSYILEVLANNPHNLEFILDELLPIVHPLSFGEVEFEITHTSNGGGVLAAAPNLGVITDLTLVIGNAELGATAVITVRISSGNFQDFFETITIQVVGKTVVEISGVMAADGVYDGQAHAGFTGTALINGGEITDIELEVIYDGRNGTHYHSTAAPVNAGYYVIVFRVPQSNVEFMGQTTVNFTIARAQLSWNDDGTVAAKDYDGTTNAVEKDRPTLSGVVPGDSVFVSSGVLKFECKNAGNGIEIIVSGYGIAGGDAGNYEIIGQPIFAAGTINRKQIIITPEAGQGKAFNTADPKFTFTNTALIGVDTIDGALSRYIGEEVGTYAFTLGDLCAGYNYELILGGNIKFEIVRAEGSASVTIEGWIYGDAPSKPVFVSDTNGVNYVTYRFIGTTNSGVVYDSTYAPIFAGSYTITATFAQTDGYLEVTVSFDFVVARRILIWNNDGVAASRDYDGTVVATAENQPTFCGLIDGNDVSVVNGTPEFAAASAGKKVAVFAFGYGIIGGDADNYEIIGQPEFAPAAINRKIVIITPDQNQNKAFNEADPIFSFDNTVLIGADMISGYLARVDGEAVGTYVFTLGSLTAGSNYKLVLASGITFEITRAAGSGSVTMDGWIYGGEATEAQIFGQAADYDGLITIEFKRKGEADSAFSAVKPVNAGEYTVRVTFGTDASYYAHTATVDFAIAKAVTTGGAEIVKISCNTARDLEFELALILPDIGVLSFGLTNFDIASVSGGGLFRQLSVSGDVMLISVLSADGGQNAAITVRVSSDNYKDFTAVITVEIIAVTTLLIEGIDALDGIFDGGAQLGFEGIPALSGGGAADGLRIDVFYEGTNGTVYASEDAPVNAGTYIVTFTVAGSEFYIGSLILPFTVARASGAGNVNIDDIVFGENTDIEISGHDGAPIIEYKLKGAPDYTFSAEKPVNAGDYVVRVKFHETDNKEASVIFEEFTIARAEVDVDISKDGWTFGGAAEDPVIVGGHEEIGEPILEYKPYGAPDSAFTLARPTVAGDYVLRITFPATVNFEEFVTTVNFTIARASGASVTAPAAVTAARTSITVTPAAPPANGQVIEYAISTTNTAPEGGWQTDLTFAGLEANTYYYIFARTRECINFETGAASVAYSVRTQAAAQAPPTIGGDGGGGMSLVTILLISGGALAFVAGGWFVRRKIKKSKRAA
jgi:hypothetical protein